MSGTPSRTLFAQSLTDGVDDPNSADEISDFFVLDIRSPTDYGAGHIAGATNIPGAQVAKPASLAQLPTDKPIPVVCYTGQSASQINSILNLLGYNAWTLRFGMMGWRDATLMKVGSSAEELQEILGAGLPVESS